MSIHLQAYATIVPERTLQMFWRLDGKTLDVADDDFKLIPLRYNLVYGLRNDRWEMSVIPRKQRTPILISLYQKVIENSNAVVTTSTIPPVGERFLANGTAFHIGEGYFLTNLHVIKPEYRVRNRIDKKVVDSLPAEKCQFFTAYHESSQTRLECRKIEYCSADIDLCVVSMQPRRFNRSRRYRNSDYQDWVQQVWSKAAGSVKMNPSKITHPSENEIHTIGNPGNIGLTHSSGMYIIPLKQYAGHFAFFAPIHSGNSGGPVFNHHFEVVGIATFQNDTGGVDSDGFNVAISLNAVIEDIVNSMPANHRVQSILKMQTFNAKPWQGEIPASRYFDYSIFSGSLNFQ